ncbi:hypothetical protein [Sphaerospermopsis torques-reginae]|uniref:Uncharacterized protein n=1 Tax=Sphaerospermopsis torques-reginae ITEP-024 TaxID=984208 RepID=A0ABX8WYS8_9CYAN|nr:hypothetical protein [Sphaerospermopsis torques-reginae]QYX31574.1 hypothetical protein K2F26_22730 [Sphaerospermopsis torques-reginae ITEP-024]
MFNNLTKLTYQSFQQSKSYFSVGHKLLSTQLKNLLYPTVGQMKPASPEAIAKLQNRLNQLLEADWQDSQKGIYPESVLFDPTFRTSKSSINKLH